MTQTTTTTTTTPSGAFLSLLGGLVEGDPGIHFVWSRFRMIRRLLAYQPGETGGIKHMLHHVSLGCIGHGPVHIQFWSAGLIGLHWDMDFDGWKRSGLPCVSDIAGPIQHF